MRLTLIAESALLRIPHLYSWVIRKKRARDLDKELFLLSVRRGDVVLDIGANGGYYTALFSRLVGPRGRVHAFEPLRSNFAALSARVARLSSARNVSLCRAAVAEVPGMATMFVPGEDGGQASLRAHGEGSWALGVETRSEEVATRSLDEYAASTGMSRLDFLKCDVEGAELSVLRGGSDTIRAHRPLLHVELSHCWAADFGYKPGDLARHLSTLGYDLGYWVNDGSDPIDFTNIGSEIPPAGSRNAIFAPRCRQDRLRDWLARARTR